MKSVLSAYWERGDAGRLGFRLALAATAPLVALIAYVATSQGTPSLSAFVVQGLVVLISAVVLIVALLTSVAALVTRRGSFPFAIAGAMLSAGCGGGLIWFFVAVAS